MSNSPKISVIVPVYNVEKYLDKCIESIVNQTYKNLEIILVDDGSPDNCPQMCDAWAEKDERIKVIHKRNGGVSFARNAGLDIAVGDYINFIDSDDFVKENMLEALYEKLIEYSADMSACNYCNVDESGKVLPKDWSYAASFVKTNKEILINYLGNHFVTPAPFCKLYSSEIISNNHIRFDEKIKVGEDFLFNYYFFKYANSVVAVEDSFYFYRIGREDSATGKANVNTVSSWKNTKTILLQTSDSDIYETCLNKYCAELLVCLRELLKSGNKELINNCFDEITSEIVLYSKEFLTLSDLSKINKNRIKLICFSPKMFKCFNSLFLKIKG